MAAAYPKMLEHDRQQAGWSVGQAAWQLGVSIAEYRELEAGKRSPDFETWDRICKLFGWPQTFVGSHACATEL
jgi:predicted transcriptional regulator